MRQTAGLLKGKFSLFLLVLLSACFVQSAKGQSFIDAADVSVRCKPAER